MLTALFLSQVGPRVGQLSFDKAGCRAERGVNGRCDQAAIKFRLRSTRRESRGSEEFVRPTAAALGCLSMVGIDVHIMSARTSSSSFAQSIASKKGWNLRDLQ